MKFATIVGNRSQARAGRLHPRRATRLRAWAIAGRPAGQLVICLASFALTCLLIGIRIGFA